MYAEVATIRCLVHEGLLYNYGFSETPVASRYSVMYKSKISFEQWNEFTIIDHKVIYACLRKSYDRNNPNILKSL